MKNATTHQTGLKQHTLEWLQDSFTDATKKHQDALGTIKNKAVLLGFDKARMDRMITAARAEYGNNLAGILYNLFAALGVSPNRNEEM